MHFFYALVSLILIKFTETNKTNIMKIKYLKEPYRSIAEFDCKKQGKEKNIDGDFQRGYVINWHITKAGFGFYKSLDRGIYPLITEQIKLDYPEVFKNKEEALKMEKEFKFKVGDKIKSKGWKDVVEIISLKGENEYNFTGIDLNNNKVDGTYVKYASWELYKEPKEKIKLRKFYVKKKEIWTVYYSRSRNIYENEDYFNGTFQEVLTEQEFLEQFEII